jgi:hypothetical protein
MTRIVTGFADGGFALMLKGREARMSRRVAVVE